MTKTKQADPRPVPSIITVPRLSGGLNKLSIAQLYFASWCSVPAISRQPRSMTDLAKYLQVGRTTLYAWKRDPALVGAIKQLAYHYGQADYGRVLGAVIREAVKGSVAHARLYFELLGDLGRAGELPPAGGGDNYFLGPTVVDERRVNVTSDAFADFITRQYEQGSVKPQ